MRLAASLSSIPIWIAALAVMAGFGTNVQLAYADDPEIHAALTADEIFFGESVTYQIEIRNSENPVAPDMSAIKQEFEVMANGEESRNQSSVTIINGRVSRQNILSHVYQYQLTPRQAGNLTIPAATATIDGKSLTSRKLPLKVIAAEKQDSVLVEVETSHQRVYPTQPFTVKLKILVQPLPNGVDRDPLAPLRRNPPHIQINWVDLPKGLNAEEKLSWLQPLLSDDGVGFTLNDISARTGSFFDSSRAAVFNLAKGRETRDGIEGQPIRYFVYELSRTLTPERTGTFVLGPAVIKGTFAASIERGELHGKKLVTTAAAQSVEVLEVPSPRPATYCGGIGEYRVTASAKPTKLRVGDPLTLTVELERGPHSGSLELISAPDLAANPEVAENFELIDKAPTGRVEGNSKKFTFSMRPKRAGVAIPALTISTFNPEKEQFTDVATATIPLEVTQGQSLTGGDLVGSRPDAAPSSIKTRAQGIFQNITDPSEVHDDRISLMAWGRAALGVWCLTGLLIAGLKVYRSRASDPVWMRRWQARRIAIRRIDSAAALLNQGSSVEVLRQIRAAVVGLVADCTNRVAEGMTPSDIDAALAAAGVPAEERSDMSFLLMTIESAEYGAATVSDATTAIGTARQLISRISPFLERGP